MIRAGTPVTFQVQGQARGILRPDATDLRAQVIGFLSGFFFVQAVEINIRSIVASIMAGELWNYDYTAIVTVIPRSDYASVNDVGSVVGHAFYISGGAMPTVSSDMRETGIGGISEEPANVGAIGGVLDSIASLPTLLVVGIVVIVAVVAFSPTGRIAAGRL